MERDERPGAGAVVVASARVAYGGLLLAGAGLARLLDVAVAAGDGAPAGGAVAPVASVAHVARVATAPARLTAAALGAATPRVVREPIERRVAAWRASDAEERERSRVVAVATLETAATFMTDWIVERLPLDDIIAGLELTDVIVSSTGGVTGRVLDTARSRALGADALVDRAVGHLRRRPRADRGELGPAAAPPAPP